MVTTAILLFVAMPISGYLITDRKHGDGCAYTFQVWRPEEDVLDRLRHLELSCANVTSAVDARLAELRNLVMSEILDSRNESHRLAAGLMEQRLRHAEQEVELKDVRLALYDVRKEMDRFWRSVGALQSGHQGEPPPVTDLDHVTTLVGQLKNGVGDLKAEWLLIKREVTDIRAETVRRKLVHDDLRADMTRMKSLVDGVRTQVNHFRSRLDDLAAAQQTIGKDFGDPEAELARLRDDVTALRARSESLEDQVRRITAVEDEIRTHIRDLVSGSHNVSAEDVVRLLQKMALQTSGNEVNKQFGDGNFPTDCQDVYSRGARVSGVYQIKPKMGAHLDNVYCEMINNSGWTLLMRRQDGTIRFTKGWLEYKHGFGSLYGEFWLGNEKIHQITKQKRYKLRVDLWDWEGGRSYAEYETFYVGSAESKYKLRARDYSGDAGDSLSYHDDMAFSTEDSDNDLHMSNCAETNKGGWWYNSCYSSNLNGLYRTGWYTKGRQTFADGVVWYTLKESEFYSLRRVEMKVIPLHAG